MKVVLILVAFATGIVAKTISSPGLEINPVLGYLKKVAVPRAKALRSAEEAHQRGELRITGGQPAALGQLPYQAGVIVNLRADSHVGVCGGSLVTATRVLTAAHCWSDGFNQATRMTVVLGSIYIFSGGTRLDTTTVVTHPNWDPIDIINDIAVVYLPAYVPTSNTIAPIALPSGSELDDNFSGSLAIISGFGITSQGAGISANQFLSFTNADVITNEECARMFGSDVRPSNVCGRGIGNSGGCASDSGGPLAITRNNRPLLIGVLSFGPNRCGGQMINGFARVTSFINFISQNL